MNSKTLKKQRELKQKLMAAISMLLVSSLMMVTSTYAWFTLSTAPEVTGITTAVGANGNLEMALQPYNGDSDSIKSEQGDSVKIDALRNITWGNLVDLKSNETYGLNMITLYPSQLNLAVAATGNTPAKIAVNPLSTPEYGADGRVSNLVSKTIMGVFNSGEFNEEISVTENGATATINNAKGVRAIGIASGMSARQLAYRSAVSTASTADGSAKQMASNSLNNYGDDLASMAMDYALAADKNAALFDQDDVDIMITVVNELLGYDKEDGAGHVTGALEHIENALKNYVLANSLANASDDNYQSISEAINAKELKKMSEVTEAAVPTNIATYINQLYAEDTGVITKVEAAKAALTGLSGGSYTWTQISAPLNYLIDTDKMTINGMTVEQAQADKNALINTIIESQLQIKVELMPGAGVYADIADFCGDYNAGIELKQIKYESYGPWDLPATMITKTEADPVYLKVAAGEVTPYTDGGVGATTNPISEFYGYIIDLAFRTNAANSYLQLQSTGIDRIYTEGSTNPATMGGGATMTFSTPSLAFNATQVKSLMEKIRVVLFDTDSSEVVGYARLDATKIQSGTEGYTMPLMLTDAEGRVIANDPSTQHDESIAIMALTQNQVHELSVMVYLDGTTMTNADVAADVAKSLVGSMNLQFSSSATLVPMEYADLKTESSSTTPSSPTVTDVTYTISDGYTVETFKHIAVGTSYKMVALIKQGGNAIDAASNVTVEIDGKTATYETFNGYSGWVVDGAATAPTGPVAITVATN